MGLGQLPGPGVDPDVTVEVKKPHRVRSAGGMMPPQGGLQLSALAVIGELREFAA